MIIKTKDFKEAANKIFLAVGLDKNAANLELVARNNSLYLNVTNKEYYVSVKFPLDEAIDFHAVVDATQFLELVSGIEAETVELVTEGNAVAVKFGRSNYKVNMIYENETLMPLPVIRLANPTVEMSISKDILDSILLVNSKEVQKAKRLNVTELSKLYYIDQEGCLTFTTGACINKFTLDKPVNLLLNERIVKLFKLFNEDVHFSYGNDTERDGSLRPKVVFETEGIYVAARITCDDTLISRVKGNCNAVKTFLEGSYANNAVVSTAKLSSLLSRIMSFTKNGDGSVAVTNMPIKCSFNETELLITDLFGNTDAITTENEGVTDFEYTAVISAADLKSALDATKAEHITFSCSNSKNKVPAVLISRGTITNVIPEYKSR